MKTIAKTPREYCCNNRRPLFGHKRDAEPRNCPEWRKVGKGYITITDGTKSATIAPGLIFGIEIVDGKPKLACYRINNPATIGQAEYINNRPYSLSHVKKFLVDGLIKRVRYIGYLEFADMVRRVYPDAWIPPVDMIAKEYGLECRNGAMVNAHGFDND